jgi:hypothetical protein
LERLSDQTLNFNKGERPAKTLSTFPILKRKVGYNDAEATSGGEKRNEKRDKMEIDQPISASGEALEN